MIRVLLVLFFLSIVYTVSNHHPDITFAEAVSNSHSFYCFQNGCDWIPVELHDNNCEDDVALHSSKKGEAIQKQSCFTYIEEKPVGMLMTAAVPAMREQLGFYIIPDLGLMP